MTSESFDPPPLLYREPRARRAAVAAREAAAGEAEAPTGARRSYGAPPPGRAPGQAPGQPPAGGGAAREAATGEPASPTGRRASSRALPEGQPPAGGGAAREAIQMAAWSEDAWEFDGQPRNPFLLETLPRAARPMTVRLVAGTLLAALAALFAACLAWLSGWPAFFGGV